MHLLKEPLLHFLLGGAALFGLYVWTNDTGENRHNNAAQQIRLSSADVNWLAQNWSAQWGRAPTLPELRELATDYINEQLLEREARVLGLDNNDVIVRRRLAQKMTFLIEDTFRHVDPSEPDLQRFYATHAMDFRSEARISFKHIYFSPERRPNARSEAADALRLLLQEATAQPAGLGDPLLVQADFDEETEQAISSIFGSGFAHEVFALKPGVWSGPIQSGFGLHLVRVSQLKDAELPPLSAVRERVVEEWRSEQQRAAKQRYLAELARSYGVDIDEAIKPLGSTATSASVARGP